MKYVTDNMLNGLARALPRAGVNCETALLAILKKTDSREKLPDAEIFRFLLEKKFEIRPKHETEGVTLITSDKDLAGYCEGFDLPKSTRRNLRPSATSCRLWDGWPKSFGKGRFH